MVHKPLLLVLLLSSLGLADTGYKSTILIKETDNTPACSVGQIKVSPGTLTCGGQTATITTGGSSGGGGSSILQVTQSGVQITSPTNSINFYGGDFGLNAIGTTAQIILNPNTTDFIHNQNSLQSGATFYVSSGTVAGDFIIRQPSTQYGITNRSNATNNEALTHALVMPGIVNSGSYVVGSSTYPYNSYLDMGDGAYIKITPYLIGFGLESNIEIYGEGKQLLIAGKLSGIKTSVPLLASLGVTISSGQTLGIYDGGNRTTSFASSQTVTATAYVLPSSGNVAGTMLIEDGAHRLSWSNAIGSPGNSISISSNAILPGATFYQNAPSVITQLTLPGGSIGNLYFAGASTVTTDSGLTWDNTNKFLGVGTLTPLTLFNGVGVIPAFVSDVYSNNAQGPGLIARKGRGTAATPLRTKLNDNVGIYNARGTAAVDDVTTGTVLSTNAGVFTFTAAEPFVSTSTASTWRLSTCDFGAVTAVERLRVEPEGGFRPYSRTAAQLQAIVPSEKGSMYYCNDCTSTTICVSTGTTVGSFSQIQSPTTACN